MVTFCMQNLVRKSSANVKIYELPSFYFLPPRVMWQQWMNGILGIWVVIVPFLGLSATAFTWTLVVTGIVVAVLGFWGAAEHETAGYGSARHA